MEHAFHFSFPPNKSGRSSTAVEALQQPERMAWMGKGEVEVQQEIAMMPADHNL